MSTQLVAEPETSLRPCPGPLARHAPSFASLLSAQGYATATLRSKMQVVRNFSEWSSTGQLKIYDLNEGSVDLFFEDCPRAGYVRRGDLSALRTLLEYLREAGVIPRVPAEIDNSELCRIECDFARHLEEERGLSPATLSNYLPFIHCFLTERFSPEMVVLSEIHAFDVTRFVLRHARTMGCCRAQLMTTALRGFFRFLRFRGDVVCDLVACVPTVANWRLSGLPKSLPPEEVEGLLQCCDRNTAVGQRDYTVLLVLARLGLRAGEIVAMELDDIDWEAGVITVHGKGPRQDQLPIPQDVGDALATYLHDRRPRCSTRRVFVRARAPRRGFSGSAAIGDIVRRALKRAKLDPAHKGAHLLRHSLATNMLRQGATLAEIGEILRHSVPSTTEIYAKVDLAALAALAQPWPGGGA